MTLKDMAWTPITIHQMVSEFLQSEQRDFRDLSPDQVALIQNSNISDPLQDHRRLRLLYCLRIEILAELPPDTQWYGVQHVTHEELPQLHVIARCGKWADLAENNTVAQAAARLPVPALRDEPDTWRNRPILFGHTKDGPFTIIEGNHRLTALAARPNRSFAAPVIIGLSQTPCFWHIHDPAELLANDLLVHERTVGMCVHGPGTA